MGWSEVLLGNVGTQLGTQWELDRHTLRITEIQKLQHLLPSPSQKKKKNWASGVHAGSSHWLPWISMHTSGHYCFWPRLMAGAQPVGHSNKGRLRWYCLGTNQKYFALVDPNCNTYITKTMVISESDKNNDFWHTR
jgi:hypothetical protein